MQPEPRKPERDRTRRDDAHGIPGADELRDLARARVKQVAAHLLVLDDEPGPKLDDDRLRHTARLAQERRASGFQALRHRLFARAAAARSSPASSPAANAPVIDRRDPRPVPQPALGDDGVVVLAERVLEVGRRRGDGPRTLSEHRGDRFGGVAGPLRPDPHVVERLVVGVLVERRHLLRERLQRLVDEGLQRGLGVEVVLRPESRRVRRLDQPVEERDVALAAKRLQERVVRLGPVGLERGQHPTCSLAVLLR